MAGWNKACAEGADPDFGRGGNVYDRYGGDPEAWPAPNLGPLTEPPFYAARVLAGTIGTKGGPVTDATGTVLTDGGRPGPRACTRWATPPRSGPATRTRRRAPPWASA